MQAPPHPLAETTLFGIRLCVGTAEQAVKIVLDAARRGLGGIVCVANVDMLTRARKNKRLAELMHSARLVVTDGMPLVWALRQLQGWAAAERVYGPGIVLSLCEEAEREGLRVFFYGGDAQEIQLLQQKLREQFPNLQIAGAIAPPMLPTEPPFDAAAVACINSSGAQLLFVGLGCPKQEFWMDTHQTALKPIALGVGLAFALIAGTKSQAPAWMRNSGLEWLYRLFQEPRRLGKRYLLGNSRFVWQVLRSIPNPRNLSR